MQIDGTRFNLTQNTFGLNRGLTKSSNKQQTTIEKALETASENKISDVTKKTDINKVKHNIQVINLDRYESSAEYDKKLMEAAEIITSALMASQSYIKSVSIYKEKIKKYDKDIDDMQSILDNKADLPTNHTMGMVSKLQEEMKQERQEYITSGAKGLEIVAFRAKFTLTLASMALGISMSDGMMLSLDTGDIFGQLDKMTKNIGEMIDKLEPLKKSIEEEMFLRNLIDETYMTYNKYGKIIYPFAKYYP